MDQMARAGDLKGELVSFALSGRFDGVLDELVMDAFPGGVVNDEGVFAAVIEGFLFSYRLPSGSRVVERFVVDRRDLDERDRALVLGWLDNVQGMFEIIEPYGEDGVVAFNHVDELTYRVRSNMGAEGVEMLTPGTIMIGGIVPVGDEWMISGTPMAYAAEEADAVLAELPEIVLRDPERVFRNPEKLAEAREMQEQQRRAFIDLYGGDLVVVPGGKVHETLMAVYRRVYEQAGSKAGPWTDSDLPPLPEDWTAAESVALIYDAEDGLGFYGDYALAQQAFADPGLIRRRPYRDVISAYLREEGISPVPIRRLVAEAGPDAADRLFQKLLKKPGFSWERDGEALLRKYHADWYDNPPLPRVTLTTRAVTRRSQEANRR
ncbi:hypothetical protein [Actinomadura chokoriensis]|uniref:DUF3846 domain-containing protein n=1 Tax=Actinomadura chokoriensis TaxID=454156 RepID=A0ABV4R6K2_9ACTN